MDFASLFMYIAVIGYLFVTIYIANQEQMNWYQEGGGTRALLFIAPGVIGLLGILALLQGFAGGINTNQSADLTLPQISTTEMLIILVLTVTTAFISLQAIISQSFREQIANILPGTYNASSVVHTTALVFSLFFFSVNTILFFLGGGTEGMAEAIETQGVSAFDTILQAVLWVGAAFAGVGILVRRPLQDTLVRLGLRLPTWSDIGWGIITVVGTFVILSVYSGILTLFFSDQQLDEQTRAAESVVNAFSNVWLAFIMATSAAIGEEIFFRGALQPVFGLIPTTIFFAIIHTQVLLSVGVIGIFLVGLAFGWLRERYSTTAAIIAHFLYNFLIVLFNLLASGVS